MSPEPIYPGRRPPLRLALLSSASIVEEDDCSERTATWLAFHSQRYACELYTPALRCAEKLACRVAKSLGIPYFVCCKQASSESFLNLHFPVLGLYRVPATALIPLGLRRARYEFLA